MQDKVFAVTGAASGIGRATVLRLAELGAKGIATSDVDQAGLEETVSLCMKLTTRENNSVNTSRCPVQHKDIDHKSRRRSTSTG